MSFRPLSRSDFPVLQRWLAEPYVDAWWHEPLDPIGLEDKYGPRIDKTEPTNVFIIEHKNQPTERIQWYRWSDYSEHAVQLEAESNSAGIDITIGEPEMIRLGLGPMAIEEFLKRIVFSN